MKTILTCPICNTSSFTSILKVKDHSVSQETFDLLKCSNCEFVITSPIPENLAPYYESPNYISHTNKASGITDVLYKFARTITLRWKTNLINSNNHLQEKTLLDYGCGTGAFLAHAKKSGWNINGVEPADQPRTLAAQATETTIVKSIELLTQQTFSAITMWHVLEHVEQLNEIVAALTSRLANSGTIFIAVPNHRSLDARIYKEYWAAYDTPRHLWHFTQSNMRTLLDKHGLTLQQIVPMKLDALYVSMLSEKYKTSDKTAGIGTLIRGLLNGIKSNLAAVNNQEYSSLIYIAQK